LQFCNFNLFLCLHQLLINLGPNRFQGLLEQSRPWIEEKLSFSLFNILSPPPLLGSELKWSSLNKWQCPLSATNIYYHFGKRMIATMKHSAEDWILRKSTVYIVKEKHKRPNIHFHFNTNANFMLLYNLLFSIARIDFKTSKTIQFSCFLNKNIFGMTSVKGYQDRLVFIKSLYFQNKSENTFILI
jgi:hypothetical protein